MRKKGSPKPSSVNRPSRTSHSNTLSRVRFVFPSQRPTALSIIHDGITRWLFVVSITGELSVFIGSSSLSILFVGGTWPCDLGLNSACAFDWFPVPSQPLASMTLFRALNSANFCSILSELDLQSSQQELWRGSFCGADVTYRSRGRLSNSLQINMQLHLSADSNDRVRVSALQYMRRGNYTIDKYFLVLSIQVVKRKSILEWRMTYEKKHVLHQNISSALCLYYNESCEFDLSIWRQ